MNIPEIKTNPPQTISEKYDIAIIDDHVNLAKSIKRSLEHKFRSSNLKIKVPNNKIKAIDILNNISTIKKCLILDINLENWEDIILNNKGSQDGVEILFYMLEKSFVLNKLNVLIYSKNYEKVQIAKKQFSKYSNIYFLEKAFDNKEIAQMKGQFFEMIEEILKLDNKKSSSEKTINIMPYNKGEEYFKNLPDTICRYFSNKILQSNDDEEQWVASRYCWDVEIINSEKRSTVVYYTNKEEIPKYQITIKNFENFISVSIIWDFADVIEKLSWQIKRIDDIEDIIETNRIEMKPWRILFQITSAHFLVNYFINNPNSIDLISKTLILLGEIGQIEFQKILALTLKENFKGSDNIEGKLNDELMKFKQYKIPIVRNILKGRIESIDDDKIHATVSLRNILFENHEYKNRSFLLSKLCKKGICTKNSNFELLVLRKLEPKATDFNDWIIEYDLTPIDN